MPETLQTDVSWVTRMQYRAETRGLPPLTLDYAPPYGDHQGFTPLELVLASLSTCVGSTINLLLGKMRRTVIALDVHAEGTRRETHPTCFNLVTLHLAVTSPDVTDADVSRALQLAEETYCPVWALLKGNVQVKVEWTIARPEANTAAG